LGPLYLGIDVRDVREVLHHADITTVPHADYAIEGLINLRGQIATTIELRRRLELEPREPGIEPIHVVVHSEGEPVTLLVDAIGDVIDTEPEKYEEPPSTMVGSARDLIIGTFKLDQELLLVLDVERVVQLEPVTEGGQL
jgi:purine-binding chemotaxis protein CheW